MRHSDIYRAAADLIEPEGAWCQGGYAQRKDGDRLYNGMHEDACSWCVLGAFERVTDIEDFAEGFLELKEDFAILAGLYDPDDPENDDPDFTTIIGEDFNDKSEKSVVLAALRKAADDFDAREA